MYQEYKQLLKIKKYFVIYILFGIPILLFFYFLFFDLL